jgi:serine/threonine protein phosphatase 1
MNRLIAISDIHGCFDPFYELCIRQIDLKKSDKLILLGDYIDRGANSKEVIDFIIDLDKKGFDITPLSGNHEALLLDAYRDYEMMPLWKMNGGLTTLDSFNIPDVREFESRYIDFFLNLKYFEAVDNFFFVHGGFNDHAADPFSDIYGMIWECRTQYDNPVFAGKTIIHGHRPRTPEYVRRLISEKSNVIPIDTGYVYEKELGYGYLSALEVNSMNLISVKSH